MVGRLAPKLHGAQFLVSLILIAITTALSPSAAQAAGTYITETKGVDACAAPSVSTMQKWWTGTPYWTWYIYIGGSTRACAQSNLTASWVSQVGPGGIGWGLVPIWVGPQAPCNTDISVHFSSNTTTAFSQGQAEGSSAYTALRQLGFESDTPVVYDLESFDASNSGCVAAAKAFLRGWVTYLHAAPAQSAGVYGSSCSSALDAYWSNSPRPDWIWGANWNGNTSTSNLPCVGSTHWANRQRHKQYRGQHNETWNGATVSVDNDCANGPNYSTHDRFVDSSCA
jgi:hypothetical protein